MTLPVYLYGQPILRKVAEEIDKDYPNLNTLIENMFETMYNSDGVGLAAPQIGMSINLIVIDGSVMGEDFPECKNFKKVLINPEIVAFGDNKTSLEEGCLSLPGIHESVSRPTEITLKYQNENFEEIPDIGKTSGRERVGEHVYIDGVACI